MMEPGRVVEFIDSRYFLTGMVTRVKGNKLLLLGENDREMSISANRVLPVFETVLDVSHPRHELVRELKEISATRQRLSGEVDVRELWELLEGEGEEFPYDFLADLAWADHVSGDRLAAMYRAIFADGLYFKMRPTSAVRHDTEKVEQISLNRQREAEREKELEEGGAWLARVWKDEPVDERAGEPECRDRLLGLLRDMVLMGPEAPEYKWGQKLMERAGLGADRWKTFSLLVRLGEMHFHENLDLERLGIPVEFSDEVRQEAAALVRDERWRDEPRRDLTDLDVITADSSGARDFDDAVNLEAKDGYFTLGVHIADVSALVTPDSILDREAFSRATSIYMPDQRIPMLPEILSEERLSLVQGEERPAFSLTVDITETGDVLGYEFTPSVVRVKRQLSYQEVDAAVETDLTLGRMFKLSRALRDKRIARGALLLSMPKLNVYLTPEGEIGVNLTLWENPGRSMIGEFMILANHLAARWLNENGAPCVYRSQAEPSERLVPAQAGCDDLFQCLRQRRLLSKTLWGLEPAPHSGMGIDIYTNLTSPLRRYIDLMMQRQVRQLAGGKPPLYSTEDLDERLMNVEAVLKRSARLQNRRRRYWLMRYFEGVGRHDYEALVLEKLPHRWRIFLTDLMFDADLPAKNARTLQPGETVTVRVKKVDPREEILRFELV